MIRLSRLEKYIPKYCYQTIFDIPYIKLYESGKRVILIDIDNTMISYDLVYPTDEVIKLIDEVTKINEEVALKWLNNGAVPTDTTTYGKKQIDDMINALEGVTMKVVTSVPAPAIALCKFIASNSDLG